MYSNEGRLIGVIRPINISNRYGWPGNIICDSGGNIYTSHYDGKVQKYNWQGDLMWESKIHVGKFLGVEDGTIIVMSRRENNNREILYKRVSLSDGKVAFKRSSPPPELGVVSEHSFGDGKYETTVSFPDKIWVMQGSACSRYVRIGDCELYCPGDVQIAKYDSEGRLVSRLNMPRGRRKTIVPAGNGMDEIAETIVAYGSPVLSPNGDVYTWKRTKKYYSIVKWVWVDGPDAPVVERAEGKAEGIELRWKRPRRLKGRLEGYEIARSTEICGPFEKVGEVKGRARRYLDAKVEPGRTYYYRVRALTKKGPGGWSNRAVGRIAEPAGAGCKSYWPPEEELVPAVDAAPSP